MCSINPLGTIPGNDLDLLPLFRGKRLAEETEDLKTIAFMDPYYAVAVHIIYDRDVSEPFPVAGFVYADAAQAAHPYSYIWFYAVMCGFDTISDCPPVNVFEEGNSRLGHPADHPGDFIAEVLGEPAATVRPWDIFRPYTVLGAFDPLGPITDVNRNAIEVRGTPG